MKTDVTVPCLCPERAGARPHPDGDTITFREHLDFRTALSLRNEFQLATGGTPIAEVLAIVAESYLLYCIDSWTVIDARGKPVAPSRDAIREYLLPNIEAAITASDFADGLYSQALILPLLLKAATSSQPTPTGASTSPRSGPSETPSHSSPSLTTTIPTGDTATTSPSLAGVSS